jgi:hypothetical protein
MSADSPRTVVDSERANEGDLVSCALWLLWLLWQCIRLPLFILLAILEPVVSFVFGSLALLCILTAFFWKLIGFPSFPFALALGTSLGFGLILAAYQACLRLLSR